MNRQSKERMMYEVTVRWIGDGQQYVGEGHGGHSIVLDVSEKGGGRGAGLYATELLLIAVGKCTAVDVVNILAKQRTPLRSLRIIVTGEITESYPKYYESIHIKYIASGDEITSEKVEKAAHLSHEKYCTVSNSLTEKCKLTTSVEIV